MIQAEFNESVRYFFVFFENSLYLTEGRLPDCQSVRELIKNSTVKDSFTDSDYKFTALELESAPSQEGSKWTAVPVRQFFSENSKSELCFLCARARGLLNFRRDKVYCAKCGGLLQDDRDFTARSCTKCRKQYFPQLEPAVIVLVNKGPKI
jgi:NAD+ diphosphatase